MPGVEIQVHQRRHAFLFGVAAFGWKPPSLRSEADDAYLTRLVRVFNAVTLGFYWHSYEPRRGEPRHAEMDAAVAWFRQRGICCKGHPLAWANIPDPAWLPDDHLQIRAASLARTRELVGRFRGRIDLWDVVNEPSLLMWASTRYGGWAQAIGTRAYLSQHLHAAREANPNASLLVNEVLTQYPSYSLLDELRDETGRTLYDAVGLQSHMHLGPWSLGGTWSLCDRYARLGVPLHLSEVTILSGERLPAQRWAPTRYEYEVMQGDYVPKLYTLLFGHPAVQAIGWWDLSDRASWKGAPAGLLRPDMSPKPAYERLEELIRKQWWTRAHGETDAHGEMNLQAFYGRHSVQLRASGGRTFAQDIDWQPGRENRVSLVLPDRVSPGKTATTSATTPAASPAN